MSDKFMFFRNFKQIADGLPDDLRLQFYDAMCAYVFDEIEPDNPIIASLVQAIKPSLEKHQNWGGVRNGAGRPKQNQDEKLDNQDNQDEKLEKKEKSSFSSLLETETEAETEIKEKKIKKKKTFVPPTLEEVKEFCNSRGIVESVATKIFDYYTAADWHDSSGKKIERWKAKIIAVWDKPENHIEREKPFNPDDPEHFKL